MVAVEGQHLPIRQGDRPREARSRAAPHRVRARDPREVLRVHPLLRHHRDRFRLPRASARLQQVLALPLRLRLARTHRRRYGPPPRNRRASRLRHPRHPTERRLRELLRADRSSGTHPRSRASLPGVEAVRTALRLASTTPERPGRPEERMPILPEDSARFRRRRLHPRPPISPLGVVRVARRSLCFPDLLRPPGPHRRLRGPQASSIAPPARIVVQTRAEGRACKRARSACPHRPSIAARFWTAIATRAAR